MAILDKIDSNFTGGLRYSVETAIGVADGSAVWKLFEPNSYNDMGGTNTLLARNPINPSRQRQKGVITGIEAGGGFNNDLTQSNLEDILQGFFFADLRRKAEFGNGSGVFTAVDGVNHQYEAASGLGVFLAGDLVFASGFTNSGNNGLKLLDASAAGAVDSTTSLVAEASPPAAARLVAVGFQFAAGDAAIANSGSAFPTLTSAVKDLTQLGIIPGEWVYLGDDAHADFQYATAANNGFARVRSVTATVMTFDKTQNTMVTEVAGAKTIRIFVGRVLKNETGSSIVRRTYQLERQLGVPNTSNPNDYQAEYLIGSVPSEAKFNIQSKNKVTVDLSFLSLDSEQVTAGALKAGTRPALTAQDCFNTSSDFSRLKMQIMSLTSGSPTALFAYLTELTLTLNNSLTANEAVGVLGAFEITAGTFMVGGAATAYFSTIEAVQAVRNNSDVTLDAHLVKNNAGISIDVPLIALGNARINVEQDQPVRLPLEMQAATAASIASTLDHTLLMSFFDYLPDAAE